MMSCLVAERLSQQGASIVGVPGQSSDPSVVTCSLVAGQDEKVIVQ